MWPDSTETQAYAVLMLAAVVVIVGLLWTIGADRRHFHRKIGRQGERIHRLRLHVAELEQQADRSFDEHVATVPTAVMPALVTPSGSFPAVRSFVVGDDDPDRTTYIDARGEATT